MLARERKRDGPRHSTTTFGEIVAVAETSSQMLEVSSLSDREKA